MSADHVKAQKSFCEKKNFSFALLSDESKDTIKAYGAWGLKKYRRSTSVSYRRSSKKKTTIKNRFFNKEVYSMIKNSFGLLLLVYLIY